MTNPPNVTPEMLELLERRLAENVGDRVERTLKVRYAGIVATVLFVLGLAGYSWIENLVVKAIGPVSKDAERTIAEMSWQLDLARENKRKLDALVEQITTDADAAQRRIESFQARLTKQQEEFDTTLASLNDQLGAVVPPPLTVTTTWSSSASRNSCGAGSTSSNRTGTCRSSP